MSSEEIYFIMKENFSEKNDFLDDTYDSSITDLKEFGIHALDAFEKLILKRKEEIIKYDRDFIKDKIEEYEGLLGKEFVKDRIENEYFFSYHALIHIALKFEFPSEYNRREFLRNR